MKPPVELLPVAPDRCHASFQMDGPDYVGFRDFQCPGSHDLENSDLPMADIPMTTPRVGTSLLAPEAYLPRSFCRSDGCRPFGNLNGIQRSLTLLLPIIVALLFIVVVLKPSLQPQLYLPSMTSIR
jgi:hypothetical protein